MPIISYGTKIISFVHRINNKLKHNYISVDAKEGVVLKSPVISEDTASKLIQKKASWILRKLKVISQTKEEDIVTGSRLPYLGKRYYVKIINDTGRKTVSITFNYSKFKIHINPNLLNQQIEIRKALDDFYKEKAKRKLPATLNKWIDITGLIPNSTQFRKMSKRWGSCTKRNMIILNYELIKLPMALIDYAIVHELAHIREKRHSRKFWREVEKFVPNYKMLHERMDGMKVKY